MQIPVLFTVPIPKKPLAEAFLETRSPDTRIANFASLPSRIQPDMSFFPIPIPSISSGEGLKSFASATSEELILRGFVEVETRAGVPEEVGGRKLYPDIQEVFLATPPRTCLSTPPEEPSAQAQARLRVDELWKRQLDGNGVAVAIVDNGISLAHLKRRLGKTIPFDLTNSAPLFRNVPDPGQFAPQHGSMSAYNVQLIAPKATLLDYPFLSPLITKPTVGSVAAAYGFIMARCVATDSENISSKYRSLVINNGWAMYHPDSDHPPGNPYRYVDNPDHPLHVVVSKMSTYNIAFIFAAGNCGSGCADGKCKDRKVESIMGASAYEEVLTVGGCTVDDRMVGYSSSGPSIRNMHPNKPDVTSYTHFEGSVVEGPGTADRGTSAACAIASGCVAALRSKVRESISTAALFQTVRDTAITIQGAPNAWHPESGFGVINPLGVADALGV